MPPNSNSCGSIEFDAASTLRTNLSRDVKSIQEDQEVEVDLSDDEDTTIKRLPQLAVSGRFRILGRMSDSRRSILCGFDLTSENVKVIIKVAEYEETGKKGERTLRDDLDYELKYYQAIMDHPGVNHFLRKNHQSGFPQLIDENLACRFEGIQNYLAFMNEGDSLEILHRRGRHVSNGVGAGFPVNHLLKVGIRSLEILEFIHGLGLIHQDIHPGNFVVSGDLDREFYRVILIDFKNMKEFVVDGKHVDEEQLDESPFSTFRSYCTAQSRRKTQSRKDDMEQLALMLVDLRRSQLPWRVSTVRQGRRNVKRTIMDQYRIGKSIDKFVDPALKLPLIFKQFLAYTRGLAFCESPDYRRWRMLFQQELDKDQLRTNEGRRVD